MKRRLVIVYNTQRTNPVSDSIKRTFQPEKYPCALRVMTFGPFGMYRDWKEFLRKLDVHTDHLQRDQLLLKYPKALYKEYPAQLTYPVILERTDKAVKVFVSTDELSKAASLEELKDLLTSKLMQQPSK
jgi:hypothetical protein